MRTPIIRFTLFLVGLFCFAAGKAETVVTDSTQRVTLGRDISVLRSKEDLSFEEVLRSKEFEKNNSEVPNFGISSGSHWIKFTVTNRSRNEYLLLDIAYPILDEVELFSPNGTGGYKSRLLGEILPFWKRGYNHPDYIFRLDITKDQTKTYYLRIKSVEQLITPISINHPADLWQYLATQNLLSGIFIGAILIMFFYNLFIFFSVKDKSYIYYVIYVICVGLTQTGIKGFTFQYLLPGYPDVQLKSIILFGTIGAIAATIFTKTFLNTRVRARKSNLVLNGVILLQAVACILTLAGQIQMGFQLMQMATTFFAISILTVSGIVMFQGYKPAKFVFLSWFVLLVGAIVFALKDYGILPFNNFTSYSMQAASVIEMAFLSFGLADKINVLKKEKEASQAEALRIAEENERIIREQNVILEQKVSERTIELRNSNVELNKTLEDLKQTQSQLVESEKMASLGQLTAGIAHEINNPINFVTSNVTPLRRDVDMLLDTINTIEKVGLSDSSIEEKKKQIEEFKEEMDFDYLQTEINYLLKGIHEGASRTAEIVKGLRIFSRVDEDDLKRADVNQGLDSTLIIVNNLLGKIKVKKELNDLPLIECYPGKLNQVFLNIISNAIHAINLAHKEDGNGELEIKSWALNERVFVSIKDNGVGMEETTIKKIFEPFFTTKDVGEGTGLGMSIAYNTIKKHNGQIHLNSEPGRGSEFIIELPEIHQIVTA